MTTFERTPKLTAAPQEQKSLDELENLRMQWRHALAEAWELGAQDNTKLLNEKFYRVARLVEKKTQISLAELQFTSLDENLELQSAAQKAENSNALGD